MINAKKVIITLLVLSLLFLPLGNFESAQAQDGTNSTLGDVCEPLDLILAIDQSLQMNNRDPEALRLEAVKFIIQTIAQNRGVYCDIDDRISVISFNGSVNLDFGFLPLNADTANLLIPTNDLTGDRDVFGAIDLMMDQFDKRNDQEGRKAIGIIISNKMGSPCLPDFPCTSSLDTANQLATYKNYFNDSMYDSNVGPFYYVIGIADTSPGDFSKNIPVWNEILGIRGKFIEIETFLDLPEELLDIVQTHSNRNIQSVGCGTVNIPPFTDTLDLFIFDDDSQESVPINILGVDPTTKADKPITPSLSVTQGTSGVRKHSWDFLNLDKMVFKNIRITGNQCDNIVILLQQKNGSPELKFKEEPMPLIKPDDEIVLDEGYNLSVLFHPDNDNLWSAICSSEDYKFDITAELTNKTSEEVIDWDDGGFYCRGDEGKFISGNPLYLAKEGEYQVKLTGRISGESAPFFNFEGSYRVKPKTKISYEIVAPKMDDTIPEHGSLMAKEFWMKPMPLKISANLIKIEDNSFDYINPVDIANKNNQDNVISSITGKLVWEDNSSIPFTLDQQLDDPSRFSGIIAPADLKPGKYSLILDVPEGQYDPVNYTFSDAKSSFTREDEFFDNPLLYLIALSAIGLIVLTMGVSYLYSFSHPIYGNLVFCRTGNVDHPFAKIPLRNRHIRKKVLFEGELVKTHPLLSGIQKMKLTAKYANRDLMGVKLDLRKEDQEHTKPVLLLCVENPEEALLTNSDAQNLAVDNETKTLILNNGIQLYVMKE